MSAVTFSIVRCVLRRSASAEGSSAQAASSASDGAAGTVAAKPYDGGQATGAPDLAGQEIVLVDVPKLIGIGYFAATTAGMEQAAAELGNVTVSTDGPAAVRHRRATLSSHAVAIRKPSGLNSAAQTADSCSKRALAAAPPSGSQICAVVSKLALAILFPFGLTRRR